MLATRAGCAVAHCWMHACETEPALATGSSKGPRSSCKFLFISLYIFVCTKIKKINMWYTSDSEQILVPPPCDGRIHQKSKLNPTSFSLPVHGRSPKTSLICQGGKNRHHHVNVGGHIQDRPAVLTYTTSFSLVQENS